MKHKSFWAVVFVLALGLSVWAASQVADKAVDPVCGMSVVKEGAKWTFDYKGATYYFCSEGCKTSFAKEPDKFLEKAEAKTAKEVIAVEAKTSEGECAGCAGCANMAAKVVKGEPMMMGGGMGMMGGQMGMMHAQAAQDPTKATDPVSGESIVKEGAKWTSDYKGTTYYFCCENAKAKFDKEPDTYLAKLAETQKAEQMKMSAPMGMMGGHMQGQMAGQQCAGCMMMQHHVQGQTSIPQAVADPTKAIDPVSGKSIVKDGAKWTSDYKGTTYYFCCENAKAKFDKEPDTYLAKMAETQKAEQMKMSGHMGMIGGQMQGHMQGQMAGQQCAGCTMMHGQMSMPPAPPAPPMAPGMEMSPRHMMRAPMMRKMRGLMGGMRMPMMGERMPGMMGLMGMMEGVDRKVENTKDGVVITLTSKDPETVKKIQEHLAKMLERDAKMKEHMAKMKVAVAEATKEKK